MVGAVSFSLARVDDIVANGAFVEGGVAIGQHYVALGGVYDEYTPKTEDELRTRGVLARYGYEAVELAGVWILAPIVSVGLVKHDIGHRVADTTSHSGDIVRYETEWSEATHYAGVGVRTDMGYGFIFMRLGYDFLLGGKLDTFTHLISVGISVRI